MTTITTKLVKDGNSVAVRLPKHLLALSGLQGVIQMEVKQGQIVLRTSRSPRSGWKEQIARVQAANPLVPTPDNELAAWDTTAADGLDETS